MKRLLKIIFILLAVAIISLMAVYYYNRPKEQAAVKAPAKDWQEMSLEEQQKHSRVTFFHSGPYMASLAIPTSWEGKYRLDQQGKQARFLYLNGRSDSRPLFSLSYCRVNSCDIDGRRIAHKKDVEFVLKTHDKQGKTGRYKQMLDQVENIISSFKAFKVN